MAATVALQDLIHRYFDAHPTAKADTQARVRGVLHLGRQNHTAWALLPVQMLPGGTESVLPVLNVESEDKVVTIDMQVKNGHTNEWKLKLPDVFGLVIPGSNEITVQSYTYIPSPPSPDIASTLAFRLHTLSGPGLRFGNYLQAVVPLRAKLATMESQKAQLAAAKLANNKEEERRLAPLLRNARIMERRYKMVVGFVDLMECSGAFDANIQVMGKQRVVTVQDRLAAVLQRIQGCPSFEHVSYMHLPDVSPTESTQWGANSLIVPRLSSNLVPLPKLVETKCKQGWTIVKKLDFLVSATKLFKDLYQCIWARNVVWLTPRLDAVYANLTKNKRVQHLVAPATQLYNMFAVDDVPPGCAPPPTSQILQEFATELFYALSVQEPWATLDVTALKPFDYSKLLCDAEVVPDSALTSQFQIELNALWIS